MACLDIQGQASKFANDVGYPVLVRPSFVLSRAAMRVPSDETQLSSWRQGKQVRRGRQ